MADQTIRGLAASGALATTDLVETQSATAGVISKKSTFAQVITVVGANIAIAESQVTGLIGDLAGKQAAGAYLTSPIAESVVTGLVSDLAAKAPIASPTFTGTVTAPTFMTPATAANSGIYVVTRRDTGATVYGLYSGAGEFALHDFVASANVLTVAAGVFNFLGMPTAPTATLSDSSTNLATTAFVHGNITGLGLGTASTHAASDFQAAGSYLTGNQTITLSGDATGSGATAITVTIPAGAVTLAKMASMATASFLGRNTAGTGVPEVLSEATAKTMLNLTGTNSGDQTITLTGDVTGSGAGSFAATLATVTVPKGGTGATTLTGVLKGAGTSALSAATEGTDFLSGASNKLPLPYSFGGTGTPTIANDVCPWLYVGYAQTAVRLTLSCGTAPTGNFTVLIKRSADSGATFPDTIATVTVGTGAKLATTTTIAIPALAAGDYLRADITAVNGAANFTARLSVLSRNQ